MEKIGAKLEALAKLAKEKSPVELPGEAKPASAAPTQLPLWPEPVRGVPNSVLRSALFGAIKKGKRAFIQGEPLASVDGVTVLFTGPRLDQADLDVWEQVLNLARDDGLGCRIQFTANGFLRSIGRSFGKTQHEWLRNAFRRLAASVVEIKDGNRAYFGSLLHHGTRDDASGRYVIELNPAIVKLYGTDGWSQVEWEQRLALKGRPLAQWLHGFYATHTIPYPYKVETLHRLSGSENTNLKSFRQELREALGKVADVTDWNWKIDDDDLVQVNRKPTSSQGRHIARRKLAKKSEGTA